MWFYHNQVSFFAFILFLFHQPTPWFFESGKNFVLRPHPKIDLFLGLTVTKFFWCQWTSSTMVFHNVFVIPLTDWAGLHIVGLLPLWLGIIYTFTLTIRKFFSFVSELVVSIPKLNFCFHEGHCFSLMIFHHIAHTHFLGFTCEPLDSSGIFLENIPSFYLKKVLDFHSPHIFFIVVVF